MSKFPHRGRQHNPAPAQRSRRAIGVGHSLDNRGPTTSKVQPLPAARKHTTAPHIRKAIHLAVGSPVKVPVSLAIGRIKTHETGALEKSTSNRSINQHHIMAGMRGPNRIRLKNYPR